MEFLFKWCLIEGISRKTYGGDRISPATLNLIGAAKTY